VEEPRGVGPSIAPGLLSVCVEETGGMDPAIALGLLSLSV